MKFIVIEGPDGAGKTTQCARVVETLRAQGKRVYATREPFDYENIVRDASGTKREVALRFVADRVAHIAQMSREMLAATKNGEPFHYVVCDRYALSTMVYQTVEGGLSPSDIVDMHNIDRLWVADLQIVLFSATDFGERVHQRGDKKYGYAGTADAVMRLYRRYAGVNAFPTNAVQGLRVIFGQRNVGVSGDDPVDVVTNKILKEFRWDR